eukprot:scaffold40133_cov204-Skeletonema_marinoi.AAC.3
MEEQRCHAIICWDLDFILASLFSVRFQKFFSCPSPVKPDSSLKKRTEDARFNVNKPPSF